MSEIAQDSSRSWVVRYDAAWVEASLGAALDGLSLALSRASWREALGEDRLRRLLAGLDGVRARLKRPFCLLVIGDFKRGKSTLINALVGRELVTMDVTPETVAITELHHGPALRIEARLKNGGKVDLRPEDLPGPRLTAVLQNLPSELSLVRIEAPVELLRGLTVVDSPGTGDMLWRFDRRVAEYMPAADAIVYVVSALSPLSDTERGFLNLSLRPLELGKVLFVVNRADSVPNASDAARLTRRIADSIHSSFPDAPVFPLSALAELCRVQGEPNPRPDREAELNTAFDAFRQHIHNAILLDRDLVRGERAVSEALTVIEGAIADARAQRQALELDRGALREALDGVAARAAALREAGLARETALRAEVEAMADESVGWIRGLLERVEASVLPSLEDLAHEQVQRHFPFFLATTVRDGVAACIDAHQDRLLALSDALSAEGDLAIDGLFDGEGAGALRAASRASFQTPTWTFFDHLHVVGMFLGVVTGVVAPLLAGLADKQMAQQARAASYRQRLRAAMPELEAAVVDTVRKTYAEIAEQIVTRGRSRQEEEIHATTQGLAHALAVHDRGAERLTETGLVLDAVVDRLAQACAELEALRGAWQEQAR